MRQMKYHLKFLTPAFLGNADQSGQWRTPPFKALLRQWWRVAMAKKHGYDWVKIRETEGRLFGHAWLENDKDEKGHKVSGRASRVQIRLETWDKGNLKEWRDDPKVYHKEVGANGRKVGAHLYMGYGPLTYKRKTTFSKDDVAAIDAGQENTLRLVWPNDEKTLSSVLRLIHWFGTIGGRSRNGWGSLDLNSDENMHVPALDKNDPLLLDIARPLGECLELEWPHALGRSDGGRLLIWQTKEPRRKWQDTMQDLAKIKIEFRTQFRFDSGNNGPFQDRHLLAYPITNHNVLGHKPRLANQLRFKVMPTSNGKYRGIAYHLPCCLPQALTQNQNQNVGNEWSNPKQKQVWEKVHAVLDEQMERI